MTTQPQISNKTGVAGDLSSPRWSVVSFDVCEAAGLSYDEAAATLRELEADGVNGLCVVTDEAARRIGKKSDR